LQNNNSTNTNTSRQEDISASSNSNVQPSKKVSLITIDTLDAIQMVKESRSGVEGALSQAEVCGLIDRFFPNAENGPENLEAQETINTASIDELIKQLEKNAKFHEENDDVKLAFAHQLLAYRLYVTYIIKSPNEEEREAEDESCSEMGIYLQMLSMSTIIQTIAESICSIQKEHQSMHALWEHIKSILKEEKEEEKEVSKNCLKVSEELLELSKEVEDILWELMTICEAIKNSPELRYKGIKGARQKRAEIEQLAFDVFSNIQSGLVSKAEELNKILMEHLKVLMNLNVENVIDYATNEFEIYQNQGTDLKIPISRQETQIFYQEQEPGREDQTTTTPQQNFQSVLRTKIRTVSVANAGGLNLRGSSSSSPVSEKNDATGLYDEEELKDLTSEQKKALDPFMKKLDLPPEQVKTLNPFMEEELADLRSKLIDCGLHLGVMPIVFASKRKGIEISDWAKLLTHYAEKLTKNVPKKLAIMALQAACDNVQETESKNTIREQFFEGFLRFAKSVQTMQMHFPDVKHKSILCDSEDSDILILRLTKLCRVKNELEKYRCHVEMEKIVDAPQNRNFLINITNKNVIKKTVTNKEGEDEDVLDDVPLIKRLFSKILEKSESKFKSPLDKNSSTKESKSKSPPDENNAICWFIFYSFIENNLAGFRKAFRLVTVSINQSNQACNMADAILDKMAHIMECAYEKGGKEPFVDALRELGYILSDSELSKTITHNTAAFFSNSATSAASGFTTNHPDDESENVNNPNNRVK
jgi:hypothetical protein